MSESRQVTVALTDRNSACSSIVRRQDARASKRLLDRLARRLRHGHGCDFEEMPEAYSCPERMMTQGGCGCHWPDQTDENIEMQIQINSGHDVDGKTALIEHVETVVKKTLYHLEDHLTRVEVHLHDEHGDKGGSGDKGCTMEARPRHHQPTDVCNNANTMHQAVNGAARKLKSSLEHLFGRLEDQHRRPKMIEK